MSYAVPSEGLTSLTAAELAEKIHSREVTSREVVQAHLDRIAETNEALNSFLHVGAEEALATADAVDAALDAGEKPASALAACAFGAEGFAHYYRCPNHRSIQDAGGLGFAIRCHGDQEAARGRHSNSGQDQPG